MCYVMCTIPSPIYWAGVPSLDWPDACPTLFNVEYDCQQFSIALHILKLPVGYIWNPGSCNVEYPGEFATDECTFDVANGINSYSALFSTTCTPIHTLQHHVSNPCLFCDNKPRCCCAGSVVHGDGNQSIAQLMGCNMNTWSFLQKLHRAILQRLISFNI